MMNLKKWLPILLVAVTGGAVSIGLYKLAGFDQKQIVLQQNAPGNGRFAEYQGAPAPFDFTVPAEKALPSVVHIRSKVGSGQVAGNNRRQVPEGFEDFFGDMFGGGGGNPFGGRPRGPREGSGSGVIISPDGYIATNNHVIDEATEITVTLTDKREYKARLVGADPTTDIALLKIEEKNLTPMAFANSDNVKVGQWVLAVGNPFGYLHSTVTSGIVSAKGRNIRILSDSMSIEAFIQTDAAVNPGNSGGALVDIDGNLIGINTAIASQTGTFAGYSFAVPANLAKKVTEDLLKFGTVQRALLGVSIVDLNAQLAKELNLKISEGIVVGGVREGGSADAAGIQKNDVITKIDGQSVKSVAELQETIGRKRPGDQVTVKLLRDGAEREVKVTLKNRDGGTSAVKREEQGVLGSLGVELETVPEADLAKLGVNGGVRVKKILNGKVRNQTDMREGFVITKVGSKPVKSVDDVQRLLNGVSGGVMLEGKYPNADGTFYYAFGLDN
jgi:serine protease Do